MITGIWGRICARLHPALSWISDSSLLCYDDIDRGKHAFKCEMFLNE